MRIQIQGAILMGIHADPNSLINNFGSGSSNRKSVILDPDPSVTRDGEKKVINFGIMKTQMG